MICQMLNPLCRPAVKNRNLDFHAANYDTLQSITGLNKNSLISDENRFVWIKKKYECELFE